MSAVPTVLAMAPLSPFDAIILGLNSNPYFIGLMMLLLNLGGRFIAMEVSKGQEQFFQKRIALILVLQDSCRNKNR